jgi:hypothetical protein
MRIEMLAVFPWVVSILLTTILVVGSLGILSLRRAKEDATGSKSWSLGGWVIKGLIGLVILAFVALLVVSLAHF